MSYRCPRCNAVNQIVNQCGCDPHNLPTPVPQFRLGQIVATPGALEALQLAGQDPLFFLERHVRGDWGEVDAEDGRLNDESVRDGSRILSAYRTLQGEKLWIITEAEGDDGRRASTCILLPDEY
ncbi:MAG: hypothetical protein ACRELG_05485 [Gemmataceae bacterium]